MSTTGHENEVVRVSGLKATMKKGGNLGIFNKGTCTTAAATAAKEVTVGAAFTLTDGATVLVRFTYGISAADATLSVNSGTAKPIYYRGAALPAGLVHAKDTLLLKYNSSQWDVVGELDTTYESKAAASGGSDVSLVTTGEKAVWNTKQDALGAGTAQLLTTGTDTAERTWQAKIIADFVKAHDLNPISLSALTMSSTFKKNDVIAINGKIYRCTAATTTEKLPFTPVIHDGKLVYNEKDGARAYVFQNYTLNADWELFADCSQYFAMAYKQDKLEWDSAPTSGSAKSVNSGAVYTAIRAAVNEAVEKLVKNSASAVTQADNMVLQPNTYYSFGTVTGLYVSLAKPLTDRATVYRFGFDTGSSASSLTVADPATGNSVIWLNSIIGFSSNSHGEVEIVYSAQTDKYYGKITTWLN